MRFDFANTPKTYNLASPTTGRPIANQHVIVLENVEVFQSYDSTIAIIDRAERVITIGRDWEYSKTTGKYRNEFLYNEGFEELASHERLRDAIASGVTEDNAGIKYTVVYDETI